MGSSMLKDRIDALERYATGRRGFIVISMLLSAIAAILSTIPYYYIWQIADDVIAGHTSEITGYAIFASLLAVLSIAVYISSLIVSHITAFRISKNIRKEMVHHVTRLPTDTVNMFGSGGINGVVRNSVETIHGYVAHGLPDMAGTFAMPISVIILMFISDWRLGITILIPVFLGVIFISSMTGKSAMSESMMKWQDTSMELNSKVREYVHGMPVIKMFQQTVYSFNNLVETIQRYSEFCTGYTDMMRKPMTRFFVSINCCLIPVVIIASIMIDPTGMETKDLVLFTILSPLVSTMMMRVMFSGDQAYRVDDTLSRICGILSMEPLSEPDVASEPDGSELEFKNVTFSYTGSNTSALTDLSLKLEVGTVTALVGPSGSGKSTIAGLAGRFWDPQSGSISIGGVDMRDIGSDRVHEFVSMVFQHNHLITGSLRDNISLGRPGSTDEEILEALKSTGCLDILSSLPDGLDTLIGPGMGSLSGGEVQRVCIARAFLRDTPIVILDEATAFVDPGNESAIQTALDSLAKGRTVLMIAHRLSTVRNADRICVMDDGRIVESGTHDELVTTDGPYSRMWNNYCKTLSWRITT
ncbi:MAG: ABC transporter ATP-binding protein [Candidatus Methanomethylophilaceae archaeon]|nr:ABC transporter ATP-binding protein [Candidatus Methanomethylophilaceae archaeon]